MLGYASQLTRLSIATDESSPQEQSKVCGKGRGELDVTGEPDDKLFTVE